MFPFHCLDRDISRVCRRGKEGPCPPHIFFCASVNSHYNKGVYKVQEEWGWRREEAPHHGRVVDNGAYNRQAKEEENKKNKNQIKSKEKNKKKGKKKEVVLATWVITSQHHCCELQVHPDLCQTYQLHKIVRFAKREGSSEQGGLGV